MIKAPTIKVKLQPILKDFLISIYGSNQPFVFPKNDRITDILQLLLDKTPKNYCPQVPEEEYIEITVPPFQFKSLLKQDDLYMYCYLSPKKEKEFVRKIQNDFLFSLVDFANHAMTKGLSRYDVVSLFIEKYELKSDSRTRSTILKMLYRSKILSRKFPARAYNKTLVPSPDTGDYSPG